MTPAEDEDVIEALSPDGADPAFGECVRPRRTDGVFTTVRPSVRKTSSKGAENFESRSRSRMCLSSSCPVIARFRARWATQEESGRVVAPATWTRRVESSMKNRT